MARKHPAPEKVRPRENTLLIFLLLILAPLYGGYYNFSVFLSGAVLAIFLLYISVKQKCLLIPFSHGAVCLYGLWALYLLTIPFAVSAGMAFAGFLRVTVWVLFFLCAATYTPPERAKMLDTVAYAGAILSLLSILEFLYDTAQGAENLNGRIDGFFQYANAWAVFQLVCLVLLIARENRRRVDYAAMAVLLCGIYLSGSRGVFLLMLLLGAGFLVWSLFHRRRALPLLAGCAGVVAVGGVAVFFSGGLVLRRIQAITLSSSSLNGRLLYDLDGLKMLLAHPLGLGRGGYLYQQVLEQTGVYTLRFVHNEYLQASLDASLPAGILLAGMVLCFLLRRDAPLRERVVVFTIAAHAVLDFDFQFSLLMLLLLLCGTGGDVKQIRLSRSLPLWGVCGVLAVGMGYFSLVYAFNFFGQTAAAYRLFPADLELAEERLQSCATVEEAEPIADKILSSTDLSMLAWDCKFAAAAQRADTAEMVRTRYQYLRLNRYRGEVYEDFTSLLENACASCSQKERLEYAALAQAVISQLEEVNRNTSFLAYRIADKPELEFSAEIISRLSLISEKG